VLAVAAPDVGAGVASAAQTGTTIKANNSNKYFMVSLPIVFKDIYSLKLLLQNCRVDKRSASPFLAGMADALRLSTLRPANFLTTSA
jgi:hypothetical protein